LFTIAFVFSPIASSLVTQLLKILLEIVLSLKFGISSLVKADPAILVTRPYLSTVILLRMPDTVFSCAVNVFRAIFTVLDVPALAVPNVIFTGLPSEETIFMGVALP